MAPAQVDVTKADPAKPAPVPKTWQNIRSEGESWESFRTEMDRLVERFLGHNVPHMHRMFGTRAPAVDIGEDRTAWWVKAELPGLDETDVEVVLASDMLTLRGEKRRDDEGDATNFHVIERSYGSFKRGFAIPKGIDRDAIAATFSKGVLTVTLPKRPGMETEERHIEVKATD